MAGQYLAVKEKVQAMLTEEFGQIQIDRDGDFSMRCGSARVFVRVKDLGDENTVVKFFSFVVSDAKASPELFHYVATKGGNYFFGALYVVEDDDDPTKVDVLMGHRLLGDYLDPEELFSAAIAVAQTADDIDDELVGRFGGRVFHDDNND